MKLIYHALTDVGLVRENNEDCFLINEELGLYLVADGMGGHLAGEVASRLAVNRMEQVFKQASFSPSSEANMTDDMPAASKRMVSAILAANDEIRHSADADDSLTGMGTTVVGLCFDGQVLHIGHAGDSRFYLFRGTALKQITDDHSLYQQELKRGNKTAAELEGMPMKNSLVRALGHLKSRDVSVSQIRPELGDIYLLCSDGLHNMVNDRHIAAALAKRSGNLPTASSRLLQLAKDGGGKDNITLIILEAVD